MLTNLSEECCEDAGRGQPAQSGLLLIDVPRSRRTQLAGDSERHLNAELTQSQLLSTTNVNYPNKTVKSLLKCQQPMI